jgi:hypothetical protein
MRSFNHPQLGVARARVDVAMRIERHLAVRMASEPDPRAGGKFLALTAPTPRDVVNDNTHCDERVTRTRLCAY